MCILSSNLRTDIPVELLLFFVLFLTWTNVCGFSLQSGQEKSVHFTWSGSGHNFAFLINFLTFVSYWERLPVCRSFPAVAFHCSLSFICKTSFCLSFYSITFHSFRVLHITIRTTLYLCFDKITRVFIFVGFYIIIRE